ncbi:MAG: sulfatase-like hydrolase/transferase [Thermoanaerobaculia bacterium]|nr:sulfatase-like hydrolase/transferase [Thermoanaerobaculia bacterium]
MCTLWVAQPIYDLVGGVPDYFLVRGLNSSDIVLFAVGIFVIPPLVLVALVELLGLAGFRRAGYRTLVAALAGWAVLVVAGLLDHSWSAVELPAWLTAGAALAAGWLLFWRPQRQIGYLLRLLAVLAPLAPLFFFLRPEIRAELGAALRTAPTLSAVPDSSPEAGRTHIVVLVLDELPVFTLLDPQDRIDRNLFPNLAELADSSSWFRQARTPRWFTQHAVPALVAGRTGELHELATARSYPANLLTLMRNSHRVISDEPITAFDPNRSLAPWGDRLAAMAMDSTLVLTHVGVPSSWSGVVPRPGLRGPIGELPDPTQRFEAFLDRLGSEADAAADSGKPLLVFSHLLLPHHPWLRDAEGELYDAGDEVLIAGLESPEIGAIHAKWRNDWETVLDAYERHVLQTQHADRLVGRLMDLLRDKGIFDNSLIVIASDHGIRFAPGEALRQPGDDPEVLERVPLLLKTPGQTEGFIDDAPRSTLDVLPTILDALEFDASGLDLAGTSLLLPPAASSEQRMAPSGPRDLRERWWQRRELSGPEGFGPWYRELAGRRLRLGGVPTRDWMADVDRVGLLEDPLAESPPLRRLAGNLRPRRPEALEELIDTRGALPLGVGIDGVMVATTRSSQAKPGDEELAFSVLLPAAVEPGRHQVVLYLLTFQDGVLLPPLPIPQRLGPSSAVDSMPILPVLEGEARAIRFSGISAPLEIFGWVAQRPAVDRIVVSYRGRRLADARWIADDDVLGYRYRFDGVSAAARRFRATVPVVDDLRILAVFETGERVELPLEISDESAWRVTGPFRLESDPRNPAPAFQNY